MADLNYLFIKGDAASKPGLPVTKPNDAFHAGDDLEDCSSVKSTGDIADAPSGTGQVILTPRGGNIRVTMGESPANPTTATGLALTQDVQYTFAFEAGWVVKALNE